MVVGVGIRGADWDGHRMGNCLAWELGGHELNCVGIVRCLVEKLEFIRIHSHVQMCTDERGNQIISWLRITKSVLMVLRF